MYQLVAYEELVRYNLEVEPVTLMNVYISTTCENLIQEKILDAEKTGWARQVWDKKVDQFRLERKLA